MEPQQLVIDYSGMFQDKRLENKGLEILTKMESTQTAILNQLAVSHADNMAALVRRNIVLVQNNR